MASGRAEEPTVALSRRSTAGPTPTGRVPRHATATSRQPSRARVERPRVGGGAERIDGVAELAERRRERS